MPKRTNLFQEVVAIVHAHMAQGAVVEESAMLQSRSTGQPREVDVVIRAKQLGHELVIAVEAVARARKADRTWVDGVIEKHRDLETNKLILVSEKGFTKDAESAARAAKAVPLTPEILGKRDLENEIISSLPVLWPKILTFHQKSFGVTFTGPTPDAVMEPPLILTHAGETVGDLPTITRRLYCESLQALAERMQLATIEEYTVIEDVTLLFVSEETDSISIRVSDTLQDLYLRGKDGALYRIHTISVVGNLEIAVNERIPLKERKLGETRFQYGEGKIGDRKALLVLSTQSNTTGVLTVRLRPQ